MPRIKSARNTKIKKKCVKSTAYPCGFTCIARYMPNGKERVCRNVLRGQADTFSNWLKMTEERLAKVNAYRSSKGKDTLALKNDVALVKVKSPQRQETSDSFESAIAKAEKGNRESNRKVKESLEGWEKYKADTVAETQAEADGKLSHLSDYRKGRSITQGIEATPGDVIPFGKKTEGDRPVEPSAKNRDRQSPGILSEQESKEINKYQQRNRGRFAPIGKSILSHFSEGGYRKIIDETGTIPRFAEEGVVRQIQVGDKTYNAALWIRDNKPTATIITPDGTGLEITVATQRGSDYKYQSIARQKEVNVSDELRKKLSDRPVESKPTGQSNPKSQLEALKAEENRLGKQLDALLNKYTGRRTPAQQSEIDALQSEYRKANRAVRNFNQGKPI